MGFLAGFVVHVLISRHHSAQAAPIPPVQPVPVPAAEDDEKTVNPYTSVSAESDDDEKTVNPYTYAAAGDDDDEKTVNPYTYAAAGDDDDEKTVNPYGNMHLPDETSTFNPYAGPADGAMFDDEEEETVNPYAAGWASVTTMQLSFETADGPQTREISFDKNLLIGGKDDALGLPPESTLDCQLMLIRRSGIIYAVKTSGHNQQAVAQLNGSPLTETLMPVMEGDIFQLHHCTVTVGTVRN